jgi:branched-chain amino acid transport system substrate-binding protein
MGKTLGGIPMKTFHALCVALVSVMSSAATAAADILIGVAAPQTGWAAVFGEQIKRGVEQAATDINAAGGINGEKIKLMYGDDGGDVEKAKLVAKNLIAGGAKYVVGHYNSGPSIYASNIYARAGVLIVTPGSTNPMLTDRGLWNTFRTTDRDDRQGDVAGSYIANHFKDAKIAILHDNSDYGRIVANHAKKALNSAGTKEALFEGVEYYRARKKDFTAIIAKMKKAGVTFVYWGGIYDAGGLLIRQASEQGLKAQFMSDDGLISGDLVSVAGPAAENVLLTFATDQRNNPAAKDVVTRFRANGFEPEAYTLNAYAAVQLIAEAANKVGKSDRPKDVAAAIKLRGPWKTVLGDLSYDRKGDTLGEAYDIYRFVKNSAGTYSIIVLPN